MPVHCATLGTGHLSSNAETKQPFLFCLRLGQDEKKYCNANCMAVIPTQNVIKYM
jgi:hypothetical protein